MSALVDWNGAGQVLQGAWTEPIGWALVHSVWQIALAALVYALLARLLRRAPANVRYVLGCATLAAMVAAPAATVWQFRAKNGPSLAVNQATVGVALEAPAAQANRPIDQARTAVANEHLLMPVESTQYPAPRMMPWRRWLNASGAAVEPHLATITATWLLGVLLLALRPAAGLWQVHRFRTHGQSAASAEVRQMFARVAARLRVAGAVRVAESALVEVPTVVGYFKPVVLLPLSAALRLDAQQLELVLAHELAHVRRHDYLVNLMQTAIEALLFYHPAVWWVSSQVRRERENCCDDAALAACGNRAQYIRALCVLEERRRTPALALGANGGSLLARVRRIAGVNAVATRGDQAMPWLAGLMAVSVAAGSVFLGELEAEETQSPPAEQQTANDSQTEERPTQSSKAPPAEAPVAVGDDPTSSRTQYDVPRAAKAVDQLDGDGFSQLHRAAMGGHVERIRELLRAGADVNVEQFKFHGTPLQYAASGGHGESVTALLEGGAEVDSKDANGRTPLIWAAMEGHSDVIRRLLDWGANIQATNDGGWTPLHYAVSNGHDDAARLLINRGADAGAKNSQGKTPAQVHPSVAGKPGEAKQSPLAETPDLEARREAEERLTAHEPSEVIATVHDKPITWSDIRPSAEWLQNYAESRRTDPTSSETPMRYVDGQLSRLIALPLLEEFRKAHDAKPTEAEINEFIKRSAKRKAEQRAERIKERDRLAQEVEQIVAEMRSTDLPQEQRQARGERLKKLADELARQDQYIAMTDDRGRDKERHFAEWYVGSWKLQSALHKEYGGRAIWQQVGVEAVDAMRELLRERERDGTFTIYDPELNARFWDYFVREHPFTMDEEKAAKLFEHPWSTLDETNEAAGAKD